MAQRKTITDNEMIQKKESTLNEKKIRKGKYVLYWMQASSGRNIIMPWNMLS